MIFVTSINALTFSYAFMKKELKQFFVDNQIESPDISVNINVDCGSGNENTNFLMPAIHLAYFDRDEYSSDEGHSLGNTSVCGDGQDPAVVASVRNMVFSAYEKIYTCTGVWQVGYGAQGRFEIYECQMDGLFASDYFG